MPLAHQNACLKQESALLETTRRTAKPQTLELGLVPEGIMIPTHVGTSHKSVIVQIMGTKTLQPWDIFWFSRQPCFCSWLLKRVIDEIKESFHSQDLLSVETKINLRAGSQASFLRMKWLIRTKNIGRLLWSLVQSDKYLPASHITVSPPQAVRFTISSKTNEKRARGNQLLGNIVITVSRNTCQKLKDFHYSNHFK